MIVKFPCKDCLHKDICKIRDNLIVHDLVDHDNTYLSLTCSKKIAKEVPPKKGVLDL